MSAELIRAGADGPILGHTRRRRRQGGPGADRTRRLVTRVVLSRIGRFLVCGLAPPWTVQAIIADVLGRLWEQEIEVPAVHRRPWRVLAPRRSRRTFALAPAPVSIRESRPLPREWAGLGAIQTLEGVAGAALRTIESQRPRFHRSLVAGRLLEADGTTVLVTGLADDGEEVLAVPWSAGEPFRVVGRRLVRARRELESPFAEELWRRAFRDWRRPRLPAPQAVISAVGHLGIENPETAPFASGGAVPLAIVVGRSSISLAWDHRVYAAPDAAKFYEEFFP